MTVDMTTEPEIQPQPTAPSREGKGKRTQEKIMIALGLVFVLGVVVLTVLPPSMSGFVMPLVMLGVMYAMFGMK